MALLLFSSESLRTPRFATRSFFDKLSDLYIRIVDKYFECFPQIDVITLHDDWGSQLNTFFSPETAEEMIVPYMRKLTDFIHAKGKYADLHSCGNNIKQVPNMIKAGFDSWTPQAMNDIEKIYDLYGDEIIISTMPEKYDVAASTEEEQRAQARAYANRYCRPDKPSTLNLYAMSGTEDLLTRAFREELYNRESIMADSQSKQTMDGL